MREPLARDLVFQTECCPAESTIEMAASGAIEEDVADEFAAHLASCFQCARLFEERLRSLSLTASDFDLRSDEQNNDVENPGFLRIEDEGSHRSRVIAGRFRIVRLIARGGMAEVYQCHDFALKRHVAIKIIRADKGTIETAERFEREARIQSALNHPNIVSIYEVGRFRGANFIVMELVEGPSLKELLADRPLGPLNSARIIVSIARALHFAHERGVLHRDVKPANVILAPVPGPSPLAPESSLREIDPCDWSPKIADFGLARVIDTPSDLSQSDAIIGTPVYLSPEQASGRNREIGTVSDIYGLGVILYECITGTVPFRAESVALTLGMIIGSRPVPPGTLQSGVPRDLETICLKCLEKEPGRRYANAADLADDLDRFLAGKPVLARPTPWFDRLALWANRNRPLSAAIAASFLLLVLIAGLSLRFGLIQTQLKEQAETESNRASAAAAEALAQRDKAYARYLEEAQNLFTLTAQMQSPVVEKIDSPEIRSIRQTAFMKFHNLVDRFVADPEMVGRYPSFTLEFLYHSAALSRTSGDRARLLQSLETMLRIVPPGSLADARAITLQINSFGNLALYRYQDGNVDSSLHLYERLLRFGESLNPNKLGYDANVKGLLLTTVRNYAEIQRSMGKLEESERTSERLNLLQAAWNPPKPPQL